MDETLKKLYFLLLMTARCKSSSSLMHGQLPPRYFQTHNSKRLLLDIDNPEEGAINIGFINDAHHPSPRLLELARSGVDASRMTGFNYVLRGTGTFTGADRQVHKLYPGVFFHFNLQSPRRLTHDGNDFAECYVTTTYRICEMLRELRIIPGGDWVRDIGLRLPVVKSYEALARDAKNTAISNSVFLRHLCEHFEKIYALGAVAPDRKTTIQQACDRLRGNLEQPLNIPALAKQLGVSYQHLRAVFRETMGVSAQEYRIRARMELAAKLLASHPPKEVAHQLGYDDPGYFSRQFKVYIGQPPNAYRHRRAP